MLLLLAAFLAAELNPFYLKSLLWMEPSHPIIVSRLAGVFVCALPAVRELYHYVHNPHKAVRMGQHAWLLFATVCTELLVIFKWSRGMFTEPFPTHIKWFFAVTSFVLVLYPTLKVRSPFRILPGKWLMWCVAVWAPQGEAVPATKRWRKQSKKTAAAVLDQSYCCGPRRDC